MFRCVKKFRKLLGFPEQYGRPEVITLALWLAAETALFLGSRRHLAQCNDQHTGNCANQNPCRKTNPKHVLLLVEINMESFQHHPADSSASILCRQSLKR
jgi:hypothetical protein